MSSFTPAARSHTSALAALEKQALIWMARRIPPAINSDHLTALGFLSLVAAGLSYAASRGNPKYLWLVILFLVLNWFGDSLDGTLARVRDQQRPRYGFYIDHILDAIGSFFLFGGLGLSGLMSPAIAVGLMLAYYLISIEVFLATHTIGKFQLSFGAFGPTELRILLIAGIIAVLIRGPWSRIAGQQYLLFDIGGLCGIVGMIGILLWTTWQHGSYLYHLETKR